MDKYGDIFQIAVWDGCDFHDKSNGIAYSLMSLGMIDSKARIINKLQAILWQFSTMIEFVLNLAK